MQAVAPSMLNIRKFEKVCQIIDKHDRNSAKLITILQEIQEEYRYLPEEVLTFVATSLALPPAQVYGVATFYAHFALEPKGKYVIKLCDGTACHVKNSMGLYEALCDNLGLNHEKHTTDDMLFTIELVSCLGACGLAPVMVINDKVHGQVTPERAVELVEQIKAEEDGK